MHGRTDFREFARAVSTVMNYQGGGLIFRENDPPNFMYIILSGSVEITGYTKAIETIHEGNALGIHSLSDEQPRTTTTTRAKERCERTIMDRRKFRFMVQEMPNSSGT